MLNEILSEVLEAWRAGNEVRDPEWYLINGHITPAECLLLEHLSENV